MEEKAKHLIEQLEFLIQEFKNGSIKNIAEMMILMRIEYGEYLDQVNKQKHESN